jgi:hypothetical protein
MASAGLEFAVDESALQHGKMAEVWPLALVLGAHSSLLVNVRILRNANGKELGSLVFLPEHIARESADDLDRIRMLRTYGEARAFTARRVWVPGLEDPHEHLDEDAYEVSRTPECQGGEWPASGDDLALGE